MPDPQVSAQTIPMISPDGSSGDIPVANLDAARKAGFKVAVTMQSPDGKNGYVPAERSQEAAAKGFKMVPMNVPDEAKPHFWDALTNPVGSGAHAQGLLGGIEQVGGQAIKAIAAPVMHPVDAITGAAKTLATGIHYGTGLPIPESMNIAPGVVQGVKDDYAKGGLPLAGENIAGQVLGAYEGGRATSAAMAAAKEAVGSAIAKTPLAKFAPSSIKDAGGVAGLFDGPPESVMTRAVKPGKNNVGWNQDIQTALPQMKSAEQAIGRPISNIDDALEAAAAAKKSVWSHIQQRLQAAGQMGATIDGNEIADAMVNSLDKRTALQNPELAARVKATADTYRRPMDVTEAEDFLQSNNRELTGYYAKNKVSRAAAEADPTMAATVAEGDALRNSLYNKLDGLNGPGVAQIKKTYGALSNVQKELAGRQMVFARQAPINLPEQMSYLRAGGKALTGDLVGAAKDVAIQRFMSEVNSTDAQIARAFQKTPTANPFPAPANPRIAGLLQRGPLQVPYQDPSGQVPFTPPAYSPDTRAVRKGLLLPEKSGAPSILPYNPQMTAGEKSAALMQELRRRQQLALPAKASPIILPPPQ